MRSGWRGLHLGKEIASYACASCFRFLRQARLAPSPRDKPPPARTVAKSGSAAGRGTALRRCGTIKRAMLIDNLGETYRDECGTSIEKMCLVERR